MAALEELSGEILQKSSCSSSGGSPSKPPVAAFNGKAAVTKPLQRESSSVAQLLQNRERFTCRADSAQAIDHALGFDKVLRSQAVCRKTLCGIACLDRRLRTRQSHPSTPDGRFFFAVFDQTCQALQRRPQSPLPAIQPRFLLGKAVGWR